MRTSRTRMAVAFAAVALTVAACGGDTATESAPAPAPAPAPADTPAPAPDEPAIPEPETKEFIVGASGSGISQLAWIEAIDRLNADGWQIQYVEAGSNLNQQGVDTGDFQFGLGSTPASLRIINEGRTTLTHIMDLVELDWAAYGKAGLDGCAALSEVDYAVHSFSSITYVLPAYWISENCFATPIQWIVVPGSDNRLVALEAGEISASTLELSDAIALEAGDTEGRFQRIVTFADEVNVIGSAVTVNTEWAAANRGTVMTMIATVLEVSRELTDEAAFRAAMIEHLPEVAERAGFDEIVQEYSSRRMLNPNGGFSPEKIETSLEFYRGAGIIGELTAEQIADRSFLEDVLAVIGEF